VRKLMVGVVAALVVAGSGGAAWAQSRPLATEDPETVGSGQILLEAGFDYAQDMFYPASGLKGNLKRIGMSGHSFGALTTQAVSGEKFPVGGRMIDPRIKAAIMFSPSAPRRGGAKAAFGAVAIPWMLMTGTEDMSPLGDENVASRLTVFPALPPGGKYELVLYKAEHSAFTERALPGDHEKRNPNHHRAILAISTAFWDAYLNADPAAREWLNGKGPASVLEPKDRWQAK